MPQLGMKPGRLLDNPPVDGFTYSMFTLLLPTVYRANVQAQMEPVRRATRHQMKIYTAPDAKYLPIPARGQIEERISVLPGTYVWGLSLTLSVSSMFVQMSDACTETYFFGDYVRGANLLPDQTAFSRGPLLLGQPRLIGAPGQITVEIYNTNSTAATVQLALFCAEPCPRNPDWSDPASLARGPHSSMRGTRVRGGSR